MSLALALGGMGCEKFTPPAREPMRMGTMDDFSADSLGLRAGVTTLDEARERMQARALTGIAEDAFVPTSGPALAVLGADYQRRIHVFSDGRYLESVELGDQGLPYGLVVRLGADAQSTVLLVVRRDPLGRKSAPPSLLTYRWSSEYRGSNGDDPYEATAPRGGFVAAGSLSLARIMQRHGGMIRPILVGAELDEGILLLARDEHGMVWDKGYLVRSRNGAMALDAMPWAKAMRCSCVQKYSMQGL